MSTPRPPFDLPVVRRAGIVDLDTLVDLETAAFESPWTRAGLAGELEKSGSHAWIAEDPTFGACAYALFHRVLDECELLRVAVRPDARRRGLGEALVVRGLAELEDMGTACCFLEVHAANQAAFGLYKKIGFHTVGRRNAYYPDGGDGLLLRRDTPEVDSQP